MQQMGLKVIKRNVRFLNYHWGKALYCMFIATVSMSNSQNQFIQYVNSALFFILAIMYVILAVIDRQKDQERFEVDELEYADFILKQQFKSDPAGFYMQQMKKKEDEAVAAAVKEKEGKALKTDAFKSTGKLTARTMATGIEGPANMTQYTERQQTAYDYDQYSQSNMTLHDDDQSYYEATPVTRTRRGQRSARSARSARNRMEP